MKRILLLFMLTLFFNVQVNAQFKFNPQIGLTVQKLSNDELKTTSGGSTTTSDIEFEGKAGFMIGADARMGRRLYFQPGVFFAKNTTISTVNGDTLGSIDYENKIYRSSFKLKALAGYDLVHKDGFKLRVNAGPTYDFITKVDDSENVINEDNFNDGSFNFDMALGVDIWFITAELGYSYGISNAYESNETYSLDSKYSTIYFSVGVVIGKSVAD
jgi:Outer membrane protein beta-barrel domain